MATIAYGGCVQGTDVSMILWPAGGAKVWRCTFFSNFRGKEPALECIRGLQQGGHHLAACVSFFGRRSQLLAVHGQSHACQHF